MVQQVYVVRHGDTKMNDEHRIRGWIDVPLSPKGEKSAKEVAKKLAREPVDIIITGDLSRTVETAKEISRVTGKPITKTTKLLRPWNTGIYTGQPSDVADKELKDYILKTPDKEVPEGESFNTYKTRLLDTILEVLSKNKDKNVVIVNHHSGLAVIDAWILDGADAAFDIDPTLVAKRMTTEKVKPGDFEHYHGIWSRKQGKLV